MTTSVCDAVLAWLESDVEAGELPIPVALEFTETEPAKLPCLALHSRGLDMVVSEYKSGQQVKQYPFSLFYRFVAPDDASRVAALQILENIAARLEGSSLDMPEGTAKRKIQQVTLPALSDATDQYETYSVDMLVEYQTTI